MSILRRKEKLKEKTKEEENKEQEEQKRQETSTDVLTIDDERTDEVLSSVSSETARRILTSVHDSPKIPTDLAEELDVTTQNVRYHLDNLEEAGLVEIKDVRYSEKGRVMSVYRPAESPLMIVFGKETDKVLQR
jgi:DNA-binding transcriptional ArsR family regulator